MSVPASHLRALRERFERFELISGVGWPIRPTPTDGPDPYGSASPEWMTIDWSERIGSVTVGGARVDYVEMGSGPPLVLVHGLGGSWRNWLENIPALARRHRVIALDLPGFGTSPKPPWEISISTYVRLLRDLCERLGVQRASFAGNSMGGFIVTELAITDRDRIDRLVLVSPAGVTWAGTGGAPAAVVARMAGAASPAMRRVRIAGLARPRLRHHVYRGIFRDPRALRPELLWEQTVPARQSPALLDALRAVFGYDIRDRLVEIEVPTLIVWGREDRVVPVTAAPVYQRLIGENATTVIFDRCGHVPMLERPVRFNRLIEGFLDPTPGVSP